MCCVLAIFERRRGRLGSKISGCGQLAEVAVYFAMSGLPPEADIKRKGRHVRWAVESRCGAVALGRTYLLPPLSFGGASMVPPWLRFHIPLIEPDRQISRIRLSDKTSRLRVQRLLQLLNIYRS